MPQETLKYTIRWVMLDKKLIKFVESPEDYTISDKVAKFDLAKFGIKALVKVDVGINGKEVIYLRKSEDQGTPVEPEKKDTPKVVANEDAQDFEKEPHIACAEHIWTISGIPENKKVISFKESPDVRWYLVPEELRTQLDSLGIKARATVKVTLTTVNEDGKVKPAINTIQVVTEDPKSEPKTEKDLNTLAPTGSSEKAYDQYRYKNSTGNSIEHQVAHKGAVDIVVALINKGSISDVNIAKNTVTELTLQFSKDIAG